MKRLNFLAYGLLSLAVLMVVSMVPMLAAAVLGVAQLGVFLVAGFRVSALVAGEVDTLPQFLSSVGGLLVAVALVGGWFPALAYSFEYLALLQAVGVALLVLPLALPFRVTWRVG